MKTGKNAATKITEEIITKNTCDSTKGAVIK